VVTVGIVLAILGIRATLRLSEGQELARLTKEVQSWHRKHGPVDAERIQGRPRPAPPIYLSKRWEEIEEITRNRDQLDLATGVAIVVLSIIAGLNL
jgi:hypothetical protein